MSYGICMEGNETLFEQAMRLALDTSGTTPYFVEIGMAAGQTTRGILEYLAQQVPEAHPTVHSFDVPGGWSLDTYAGVALSMTFPHFTPWILPKGAQEFEWPRAVDFAFIDGCHGAACAKADFHSVARAARQGTVVVFHDSNPNCQGIHLQPHCQTGIAVRQALQELGLLNNSGDWQLVAETLSPPHGIAVFKKV